MPEDHVEETSITIEEPIATRILGSQHNEASEKSPQDLAVDGAPDNQRQPVREPLVATAAAFLQTTKVADSDTITKQLFLSKKGLTPLEIREAFVRAGLSYKEGAAIEDAAAAPAAAPPWQLPPPALHYPGPGALQVRHPSWGAATSLWQRLKDFCNLVLFITGAAYGAHYLYQHVVRPWLTGRRPPEPLELQVARLQAAVADSLVQLKSSVAALQLAVQGYTAAAKSCPSCGSDPSSPAPASLGQQLEQVKAEVTSLKSLMLNRRNFTPTPALAPSIPAWQRANGDKGSGETVTIGSGAAVTSGRGAAVTSGSGAAVTSESGAAVTSGSGAAVTSSSGVAVTSNSSLNATSNGATVTCNSSSTSVNVFNAASVVTSTPWTTITNGSRDTVVNRANSSAGPIAETECAKDSISSKYEPPVSSSSEPPVSSSSEPPVSSNNPSVISHSKDTSLQSMEDETRLS